MNFLAHENMFTEVKKEQESSLELHPLLPLLLEMYLEKLHLQRNAIFYVKTVEAQIAKSNPNIFINNLFLYLNKAQLHDFADNNIVSAEAINVNELIKTLEKENETVTDYFKTNEMIQNIAEKIKKGHNGT